MVGFDFFTRLSPLTDGSNFVSPCHPSPADVVAPPPSSAVLELLTKAALQAEERGWHLYLVGSGARFAAGGKAVLAPSDSGY